MWQHEQVTSEILTSADCAPHPVLPTDEIGLRIEEALIRLCAQLQGSDTERAAQRIGLCTRLHTLTAAYRELGSAPEQAVGEAASYLQGSLTHAQQVTERRHAAQTRSARPAMLMALSLFGSCYLADATRLAASLWQRAGGTEEALFYRIEALLVPLLVGLLVGLLAKARPVRGTFYALLLLAVVAVWLPACAVALSVTKLLPFEEAAFWKLPIWNVAPGIVGLACWPPLGCLGAAIGSGLRRKGARFRPRKARFRCKPSAGSKRTTASLSA